MLREFIRGITAYGAAFGLIGRYRLWRYVLVPLAVGLLLMVGLGVAAWGLGDDLGRWIAGWYPWEEGRDWVAGAADIIGAVIILAFGLIAWKQLVMALAAPFMSPLSEKIERELSGHSAPVRFSAKQFLADLWRGLRIALRNLWRELLFTALLLLLGLIPVFSPFTAAAIFLVQSYYAGFGNMDYTLERHLRVRDSVGFVRAHRGLALGNGLVFMALLLTGPGFLLALPLGAIAATRETVKIIHKNIL